MDTRERRRRQPPHPAWEIPASRSAPAGRAAPEPAPAGRGGSGRENAAGKFPSEPRGLAGGYSGSGAHNASIVCAARVRPGTELAVRGGRGKKKREKKLGSLFFHIHVHTHPHRATYLYSILSSCPALIIFSLPPPLICSWTTLRAFKTHVVLTPQQFD